MKEKYEKPILEIEEFKMAEHIAKCEQSTNIFYLGTCQSDKPIEDLNQGVMIFNSGVDNSGCDFLPEEIYCYNSTEDSLSMFGS